MSASREFFATAARGMEPLLAAELRALGADAVQEGRGGVGFEAELTIAYRACLWSRVANRILMPLARFPAADPEALYAGVREIPWEEHLDSAGSLAVDFVSSRSSIAHSHYGAQKVKDAVVDYFRERCGERPSVDLERPDLRINLYVLRDQAQLALDLSGDSLHRRGYREAGGAAPLKETLAAAILLRAGWPAIAAAGGGFLDPMCGSGTLPIEAALMAADIAPGLERSYYGFLRWKGHDGAAWDALVREAIARREAGLARLPPIHGYDQDSRVVASALRNVGHADLADRIHIECRPLSQARPVGDRAGLLAVNPPYGERLGEPDQLVPLYGQIGDLLKQHFGGWRAAVFTGNPELAPRVGLAPERSYQLYNGPIECRLTLFEMRARDPQAPPAVDAGGGEMLANRLRKNLRQLEKWAGREGVSNYRVYDADLPEYNLAVDLYQGEQRWLHVQEYEAPRTIDAATSGRRLREALKAIPEVLGVPPERMFYKVRRRQKGAAQYEKLDRQGHYYEVREGQARMWVNFTDYLDTGLFLDHRPIRRRIGEQAAGKRFLNLFCYTATATVHAGIGGARGTTSVDMSRTYMDWAGRNLRLNGLTGPEHELLQADCLSWLQTEAEAAYPRQFELIFLDPPSFSTSKRMRGAFDVQRDHARLLGLATALLAPGGLLIFSTNLRSFKLDAAALPALEIRDISRQSIPPDFARDQQIHHCFEVRRKPHDPWGLGSR